MSQCGHVLLANTACHWRRMRRADWTFGMPTMPQPVVGMNNKPFGQGFANDRSVYDLSVDLQTGTDGTTRVESASGRAVPTAMVVSFYGESDVTGIGEARIIGWNLLMEDGDTERAMWVPVLLAQLNFYMSAYFGVDGGPITSAHRFADQIEIGLSGQGANDDVSIDILTPDFDIPANAVVSLRGAQCIEFQLGVIDGSSMNGLFRLLY